MVSEVLSIIVMAGSAADRVQADRVLEKELRVLHPDLKAVRERLTLLYWAELEN